jgi:nonsense-mediated mRNA decay protein 3
VSSLQGVAPCKFRHDKQLVSHDTHTAEYNYKYTFSLEIVPICKDDLICLPPKVAQQHGQLGPLVVCTKVRRDSMTCPRRPRGHSMPQSCKFTAQSCYTPSR